MAEHRDLTGASLHEPKGIAAASDGTVYVASGGGSGVWRAITRDDIGSLDIVRDDVFPLEDLVWDDYVVPIVGANVAGIKPPGLVKVNDNGAGSTGVYYYGFDPTTEEEVFFTIQLPHRVKAGTQIKPHVHWGPTTTGVGNVVWGLEYCISNVNEPASNTTILTATGAAPGTLKQQVITGFPPIAGTQLRESSLLNCRFFRKAADAADTYAADAVAMSFDIHFQIEKLGSIIEYPGV